MIVLKFKKNKQSDNTLKIQRRKTAQEWMPLTDIHAETVDMRDDTFTVALRIHPANIDLLSEGEKKKVIKSCHEAFNGLKIPIQDISIGRPVDLDGFLCELEDRIRSADDPIRKKLNSGYLKQASAMASSGDTLERRFYIIMSGKKEKKAREELKNKAMELATGLSSCGLNVVLADDNELMDMHFSFTHPGQAAIERVPLTTGPYLPTVYGG